jgi:hypothetical protein
MKRPKRDPVREDRIHNEAIVDAGPEEQALSWYYYLDNKIHFPFQAKYLAANVISPLRKGHARSGPMAGSKDGRPAVSTHRRRPRRINR